MNKMINMFKDIYEKYKELREQYLKATAEDNWDLAKKIVDEVTELEKPLGNDNADMCRLYYMYKDAWDNGNQNINVSSSMFAKERAELIRLFRDNGVTSFTYSSTSTGLMEDMWDFVQAGWKVMEMTQVDNGKHYAFLLARM